MREPLIEAARRQLEKCKSASVLTLRAEVDALSTMLHAILIDHENRLEKLEGRRDAG